MPRREPKSYFSLLTWRKPCWLHAALGLLIFAASPARSAEPLTPNDSIANQLAEATNHLGLWIWEAKAADKQMCRLWKSFVIPPGASVSRAILRITVDNGYRLFLDGREIGRGSDWRTITEYDLTWLLSPGRHILAVEGFNDRLEAGPAHD
jgi:hypothetical protein